MDRRAFIAMAAGSILSAPLAGEAQQAGKISQIGLLFNTPPDAPRSVPFREGLRELGYIEGKNIAFVWRPSHGRTERYTELAGELVRLKVDVIVAPDNPTIAAAEGDQDDSDRHDPCHGPGRHRVCRQPRSAGGKYHWLDHSEPRDTGQNASTP